jgi:aspartate aminotransferase
VTQDVESLEALFEPQERADRLRALASAHGPRFCDLAYANPHDGVPEPVLAAIEAALRSKRRLDLQYTPYGGAPIARRVAARALAASHDMWFGWRDVVLTPGAMAALHVAFRSVRRAPGDEVVVVAPCWLDVPLYLAERALRPVLIPVRSADLRLDLAAIAAALGPATRAVVISQPANPTGVLYGRDELAALAQLLAARPDPPVLISDECHRDFAFGAPFVSPALLYDDALVVYSFGKRWFVQGQRIGYVAVSPRAPDRAERARALERLCRSMGFCTPTALMQRALPALLDAPVALDALQRRRARAVAGLRDAGYDLLPSDATWFLYPRTPDGRDDFAFAEALAREGVLVLPAPVFHHRGHFRISLTCSDAVLERALGVLAEVAKR